MPAPDDVPADDVADDDVRDDVVVEVPDTIPCIDCGGTCHLISVPHEDGWRPGDLATYRCADCLDRWDTIVPGPGDDADD